MTSTNPIFTIPYLFSQHEVDVSSQIMRILAKINSQKKIAERDRINSRVKNCLESSIDTFLANSNVMQ